MYVYQTYYVYTETFCHPNPDEWEEIRKVICTTLDKSLAQEIADAHNAEHGKVEGYRGYANVACYALTSR